MKIITLSLLIIFVSFSKLICTNPCNYKENFLSFNLGYLYELKDDFNSDWQLWGPSETKSIKILNIFAGIGWMYEDYSKNYFFGFDFNYSLKRTNIDNAILINIKGINKINDTIQIHTTATSQFEINSIVFSPNISYKLFKEIQLVLSFQPQLIYNYEIIISNSYTLSDTTFVRFLGKPEIKRDINNKIITVYSNHPNDVRKFDLNFIISLGYRVLWFPIEFEPYYGDYCNPPTIIWFFRLDLLIGLSPIDKRKLIIYPGFSFQGNFSFSS